MLLCLHQCVVMEAAGLRVCALVEGTDTIQLPPSSSSSTSTFQIRSLTTLALLTWETARFHSEPPALALFLNLGAGNPNSGLHACMLRTLSAGSFLNDERKKKNVEKVFKI